MSGMLQLDGDVYAFMEMDPWRSAGLSNNFSGGISMRNIIGALLICLAALGTALLPGRAGNAQSAEGSAAERTPARLSFTDGRVSFWRAGAPQWSQAVVNTPLAPGDELATGSPGTLELQVGPRAFIRSWTNSQLGLLSQEFDFLQIKLTNGHLSLDLRTLASGETVEVDTPNAAITFEHPGYYRIEIAGERTSIITRRGGRATVTPASGESIEMLPSEEVVVEGSAATQVASYAAPRPDPWDRWNYARTDSFSQAVSARYVSPGTYGAEELDRYGTWREVPEYGPLWIPTSVPSNWVPYSTGSWIMDPYYGWTWVSSLPWGWAPFHHGRWVHVDRYWGWAPGPVVSRPVYAPALVAFLGTPSLGVGVSVGTPLVGWVALGWGEPCIPWWGSAGFAHRPWWGGWGGPRFVNTHAVNRTAVINVQNITVYGNSAVPNAVVAVNHDRFGRGPITNVRVRQPDLRTLQPLHAGVPIQPTASSWVPTGVRGTRPSDDLLRRPVVTTRVPQPLAPSSGVSPVARPAPGPSPATRLVPLRPSTEPAAALPRPSFGQSSCERGMSDRRTSAPPPRQTAPSVMPQNTPLAPGKAPAATSGGTPVPVAPGVARPAGGPQVGAAPSRPAPSTAPVAGTSRPGSALPPGGGPPTVQAVPKREGKISPLPGEPANRLAPYRMQPGPGTPNAPAGQRQEKR